MIRPEKHSPKNCVPRISHLSRFTSPHMPRGQQFSLNFYLHQEILTWDKDQPKEGYLLQSSKLLQASGEFAVDLLNRSGRTPDRAAGSFIKSSAKIQ